MKWKRKYVKGDDYDLKVTFDGETHYYNQYNSMRMETQLERIKRIFKELFK